MSVSKAILTIAVSFFLFSSPFKNVIAKTAQYASINYDVVYVRCPRAKEPVIRPNGTGELLKNWKGVNDLWLSASNNIYQMPGCDLVLHHSDPSYQGGTGAALSPGDIRREEVLVNCDEAVTGAAVCSIADPMVSLDGRTIAYAKFTDTRNFVATSDLTSIGSKDGGWGFTKHSQSMMSLSKDLISGTHANRLGNTLVPYSSPTLIYQYNLDTKIESQISPAPSFFAGRAFPGQSAEFTSAYPVMDSSPFFLPDGRVGFVSNRADGFQKFQIFAMETNGANLELLGHRAMSQQLHPIVLKDGRIIYTSMDASLQKVDNNNYSLFEINPDGSNPFILAGENDATKFTYHYVTQLTDGDIVANIYYNHNNAGLGGFLRFPIEPSGPNFVHASAVTLDASDSIDLTIWNRGITLLPFARPGQFNMTPDASNGDNQSALYASSSEYWDHPNRAISGTTLDVEGTNFSIDKKEIVVGGKFTHPSGGPNNDLLATYTIGGSSTMPHPDFAASLGDTIKLIGKDAGIWLMPLNNNAKDIINNVADDARIVVDHPQYHEIMPRAVASFSQIYNQDPQILGYTKNTNNTTPSLTDGSPFGLTGATSLLDRETMGLNGVPWNMSDGGGVMSGRTYLNLAAQGGDLSLYDNDEIVGVRVTMLMPTLPNGLFGGVEDWAGVQSHHLRVLGEFPVRKFDGSGNQVMNATEGQADTGFLLKIPSDTPFLFQALDKNGMALNLETTSRTVARGEQQVCSGCHVHTREGNAFSTSAASSSSTPVGDFSFTNDNGFYTGVGAYLFNGLDANGSPTVSRATEIYSAAEVPGVDKRKSFGLDWENNIKQVIENRCSSCHQEGASAFNQTGLRLRGDDKTYDLLIKNSYVNDSSVSINSNTLPGDGLTGVGNEISGVTRVSDRLTPTHNCCRASRWISLNSARSSMLVWALYQQRLDGRDPTTGLPPSGRGVLVDDQGRENPEIWTNVSSHTDLNSMTENEKRLISRWIDMGTPKLNTHDDLVRPVVTVTPVGTTGTVNSVLIGLWDDSPIDYSKFKVLLNGDDVTPVITGAPSTIEIALPSPITIANAKDYVLTIEACDAPDRALSYDRPNINDVANHTVRTIDGVGLVRMSNTEDRSVQITTPPNAPSITPPTTGVTSGGGGALDLWSAFLAFLMFAYSYLLGKPGSNTCG
jgi:hypothetical protein